MDWMNDNPKSYFLQEAGDEYCLRCAQHNKSEGKDLDEYHHPFTCPLGPQKRYNTDKTLDEIINSVVESVEAETNYPQKLVAASAILKEKNVHDLKEEPTGIFKPTVPEDLQDQLEAPFPSDAYTVDKSRGFPLTSLKAQFVVERLNKVFTIFGWDFLPNFVENDKGVLCEGVLTVRYNDQVRKVYQTGSSQHKKILADSRKSAATDCLGKAASWLGVGNDVFKGNVDPSGAENMDAPISANQNQLAVNPTGGFVLTVGKFKGQRVDQVDRKRLAGYCSYMRKIAQEKGEELSGPMLKQVVAAEAFLKK